MKKIIFVLLSVFCFNIYPQVSEGWNAIDTTVIPTIGGEKVALFANNAGIHILQLAVSNPVKYFRLKSTGELDEGITADGIVIDDNGKFPNLTGDENNLYAVYQKGGIIQVKKSVNGGNTWISEASYPFSNGSTISNGVDAVYTFEKGLHIVWSQKEGTIYESYFARWYNGQWLDYTQITNHPTLQSGGFPTVTTSNINGVQRAHICINTGTGEAVSDNSGQNFSRDFNYSTWGNPIQILPTGTLSSVDRLLVTNDGWMHCFYYTQSLAYEYRKKTIESSSWSAPLLIDNSVHNTLEKIQITKTSDQMLHAFWIDPNNGWGSKHSKKSSSAASWSAMYNVTGGGVNQRMTATTSSSNDLYVVWSHNYSVPTLRYRQYDAKPLAPQNLTAQPTADYHPKLIWSNTNADIQKYYVYRSTYNGGYDTPIATVTHNSATSTQSYIDNTITVPRPGGQAGAKYYYVVSSVDIGQHVSGYSNYVEVTSTNFYWEKQLAENNTVNMDFNLDQNYPNPFNPSTTISYSIKEEGLVTLKVYDVLGKEIATLVNENKPAGNYEVEFNASSLPSGMYIYKLQAGSFTDVKKMLLTK